MTPAARWDELEGAEEPAAEVLARLGYTFIPAGDLAGERQGDADPLLAPRLTAALKRLNPGLDDRGCARAIRQLVRASIASDLPAANEAVRALLVHGLVQRRERGPSATVRLLDFEHPEDNDRVFTRRFPVVAPEGVLAPDLVVFVNGIPLAVIECQSPALPDPVAEGVEEQLRRQGLAGEVRGQGLARLLRIAQVLVVACGSAGARCASVGTPADGWREWTDPHPLTLGELRSRLGRLPTPQDVLLWGLLAPANLLATVRDLMVLPPEGGGKRLAWCHQAVAVRAALGHLEARAAEGSGGGLIWLARGTGKSQALLLLAVRLRHLPAAPRSTLVLVTDPAALGTLAASVERHLGSPPVVAATAGDLRRALARGPAGETVVAAARGSWRGAGQRRPAAAPRRDLVVLVDEAQHGPQLRLARDLARDLPGACLLGLTGLAPDRGLDPFGPCLHAYTPGQAVADGCALPVYRELRPPGRRPEPEGERLEAERLEAVARDLLGHLAARIRPNRFKALLVAPSRRAAERYGEALGRMAEAPGAPAWAVLGAPPGGHRSPTARRRERMLERFRDPDDPLFLLVLTASTLAACGEPSAQALYLDAPLRGRDLLAAVAAINRPAQGKHHGLLVDYRGHTRDLAKALGGLSDQAGGAVLPLEDLGPQLEALKSTLLSPFAGLAGDRLEAWLDALAQEAARLQFERAFQRFARALDPLLPDLAAAWRHDLGWLGRVRHAACLRFRDPHLAPERCGPKVRAILEEEIRTWARDTSRWPLDGKDRPAPGALDLDLDEGGQAVYQLLGRPAGAAAGDALAEPMAEYGGADLARLDLTRRIQEDLAALKVVDWLEKEDVKRRMRRAVKRRLRAEGYPTDEVEALTRGVLELARLEDLGG